MAVKIVEHSAETEGELLQLRESLLSSSIVHPNVVSLSCPSAAIHMSGVGRVAHCRTDFMSECDLAAQQNSAIA